MTVFSETRWAWRVIFSPVSGIAGWGVCDGDHRLDVMKSPGSGAGAAGASYPDTIRLRSSVFPLARLGEVVW